MSFSLGESGKLVLASARRVAAAVDHDSIRPVHLLLGVGELEDLAIRRALLRAGLDLDEACVVLRRKLEPGRAPGSGEIPLSPEAVAVLERASWRAAGLGGDAVEAQHVLLALFADVDGRIGDVLRELGADGETVQDAIVQMIEGGETTPSDFYKTRRNVEQAGLTKTAELLDSLGRDLTRAARDGDLNPIVGREREIEALVRILLGRRKNNAVLIGEAGVGKTAIVEGLAQRIVRHEILGLDGLQIRTVEVGSLVAGTIYRGQFEQRLKDLVDAVRDRTDIVLFIDEMHMLVGAGEAGLSGSVDAANMLKPVLSEGRLKVIGATTTDEYRKYLEPDRALMRRFQPIVVGEPSREATLEILRGLRPKYEEFHLVRIDAAALEAAVDLSVRYVHDRFLPDKAIDLIDRACTDRRLESGSRSAKSSEQLPVVGAADIAEVVSVVLEIPIAELTEEDRSRLTGMAGRLKERVIGQEHAVDVVTSAILRARTGVLKNEQRPYGVFLFLGPSGVGKTKLAEELASLLFGDRDQLIGIDMSHYAEPYSISELVGAKSGLVGWQEGGRLTNAVRAKPYSVVLLDEFEKAHPVVWNLFLPIFDDGRITDALDRVIDFRNTVMILTSNVGARRFRPGTRVGFSAPSEEEERGAASFDDVEGDVRKDLEDTFSPELLNRIDEIVIFNALTRADIRRIVERRIEETVTPDLELTPEALEFLADRSYEPAMGARPVRRTIQRLVANPLSIMVANGEIHERDQIAVGLSDGDLTFTKSTTKHPRTPGVG